MFNYIAGAGIESGGFSAEEAAGERSVGVGVLVSAWTVAARVVTRDVSRVGNELA